MGGAEGVPALLIERGGSGAVSEQEVDACCEDVRSLLRHLEIMPGGNPPRDQLEITETFYAEAESEGFWYPAVGLDQRVRRGELLGHLEHCLVAAYKRFGPSLTALSFTTQSPWASGREIR